MATSISSVSQRGSTEPFELQVSRGQIALHETLFKFGFNSAVTNSEETIWDQGGLYAYPPSASVMKVSSDNTGDTTTVVFLEGLDANYEAVSESVTLNGQTAVNTTNSYLRVFRARVTSNEPTGNVYIGTGTVTTGVPANVYAKITAGENQTLMAVYTVPAGHTLYLTRGTISSGTEIANKYITGRLKVRPFGEVLQTKAVVTISNNFIFFDWEAPLKVTEKSDIEACAIASSAADTAISATFEGILIKEGGSLG